ncbi:hypothetical protein BKA66DRAFT_59620 [Pyrenochaeta sp. MPI-SDFR-AT-0127]|nr:hypothetical protein BKA66DRAFT_59620 [Pyrenochaeta sp. MPI-SDFR-AT-0127]
MLARGALCRLAADAPITRSHDLPQLARILRRTLLSRNASTLPALRAISRAYTSALEARRSYATTARATKPTATVKRAVKAKAAKKAAPKKKAAPAKRPVRKTVAKKKPAPKKAVPKKRVKKVVTPEAKERATIKALQERALKEPVSYGALTGINAYVAEMCRGPNVKGEATALQKASEVSKKWKTLTPSEHEHYNHLANERTVAKRAEYQAWVNSHTPEQIRIANNARAKLRARYEKSEKKGRSPSYTAKIHDDRHVKRPSSPYALFSKERWASGDLKGINATDSLRLIANEWKALSTGEKKKYEDLAQADKERFAREKSATES